METYQQFLDRINSFEKKKTSLGDADFIVNPSLVKKVNQDNSFKNFYGDTTVFALDERVKSVLAEYVNTLYREAPQCFCERLVAHTYHVTLHDLSNSPALRDVAEEVFDNELKIVNKKESILKLGVTEIKLKSKYIFNMVNTSLVLGLYPATERDYSKLMALYSVIDDIKRLSYPLTPHVTLAYYNINGFDVHAAKKLANTVNRLNSKMDIELSVCDLFYQKFTSMNDYRDIIRLL